MVNTSPVIGRNGSIVIDGAEVGYIKGVTFALDAEILKEYCWHDDKPAVLESGNKTFKFTYDKLYIDNTYADLVLAGTKVTIILGPANSTPLGQPKITLSNAILFHHGWSAEQDGIVAEDGNGEALSCSLDTYT